MPSRQPIRCQILTQNGHSGSFKVIYFDVTENPLSGYTLCPQKVNPVNIFTPATANLYRFKWNFAHTSRHLFLSSTPSFIRIPYSVYEIFNFFCQTAVTNLSYRCDLLPCWCHLWLLHFAAGQCPSALCPWDSCATVTWDTRLHQPTGLATEQSRSQSGGLCSLGHSAGTSLPLPDPWRRSSERTTDWRVASFWPEHYWHISESMACLRLGKSTYLHYSLPLTFAKIFSLDYVLSSN